MLVVFSLIHIKIQCNWKSATSLKSFYALPVGPMSHFRKCPKLYVLPEAYRGS